MLKLACDGRVFDVDLKFLSTSPAPL